MRTGRIYYTKDNTEIKKKKKKTEVSSQQKSKKKGAVTTSAASQLESSVESTMDTWGTDPRVLLITHWPVVDELYIFNCPVLAKVVLEITLARVYGHAKNAQTPRRLGTLARWLTSGRIIL
jgi:hypothetical protein